MNMEVLLINFSSLTAYLAIVVDDKRMTCIEKREQSTNSNVLNMLSSMSIFGWGSLSSLINFTIPQQKAFERLYRREQ
jgi:hypothetical protein